MDYVHIYVTRRRQSSRILLPKHLGLHEILTKFQVPIFHTGGHELVSSSWLSSRVLKCIIAQLKDFRNFIHVLVVLPKWQFSTTLLYKCQHSYFPCPSCLSYTSIDKKNLSVSWVIARKGKLHQHIYSFKIHICFSIRKLLFMEFLFWR